jgi:hypothetical protein
LLAASDTGTISSTDFPDVPPDYLQGVGAIFCAICKEDYSPDRVFLRITSSKWIDWKAEMVGEACGVLQTAVSTKAEKLKKVALNKILLLPDMFRYMSAEVYEECIEKLQGLDTFHAVFILDAGGTCIPIHGPW